MADIAREHHTTLQDDGICSERSAERDETTTGVLNTLKPRVSPEQKETLAAKLDENDVESALRLTKNPASPGLDGIPYEVWKAINQQCKNDQRDERESFSIIELMTAAFNDVREYGIDSQTGFSDGWMCPLYKKGDKNLIQ